MNAKTICACDNVERYILPDAPECAGCGCEAEVVEYFRYVGTTIRCGFRCTCGTVMIKGVVQR